MSGKQEGIVLSKLQYGDSTLIIDFYSREGGRTTFSAYTSRKKNNKFYYSPLNLLSVDLYKSQKGKHLRLKEVNSLLNDQLISRDSEIHAIRYFLAEFLKKTLTHEEADEQLYSYLKESIVGLYDCESKSLYLLEFLESLSPYLGFDLSELQSENGQLRDFGFYLKEDELKSLSQAKKGNKKAYLNALLSFYGQQFEGVADLKSKSILAEIFS